MTRLSEWIMTVCKKKFICNQTCYRFPPVSKPSLFSSMFSLFSFVFHVPIYSHLKKTPQKFHQRAIKNNDSDSTWWQPYQTVQLLFFVLLDERASRRWCQRRLTLELCYPYSPASTLPQKNKSNFSAREK